MLASIIEALRSLFKHNSYGHELERYIISRFPQSTYDVEKMTREYEMSKMKEGFL